MDDPLWPLLAAACLPCSSCVRSKKSGSCSVVPHLARCSNCDDKKPCVLGRLARFRYFARKCSRDLSYAHRFLEVHGDPRQRTRFSLLPEQWRTIANKIESSTNSTQVLLELSLLDDQDRLEEDRLELQDFVRRQPRFPIVEEAIPSGPRRSPAPGKVPSIPKKRKRTIRVGEPSSSKRKHSVEPDSGLGNAPDYRRVVLVLPPRLRVVRRLWSHTLRVVWTLRNRPPLHYLLLGSLPLLHLVLTPPMEVEQLSLVHLASSFPRP
ncbi:hypothetical protein C8R41DRAFT_968557 [Lentinula lateritia]|uniref:Uncharacterized protein n=1 Tax=Lentinula lateritia TaxID=40482 RepID=A0ABQ8V4H3_9AGAR|nr:hypothetical protein C8R41DRAFT_968557 [Lentinula lateritia]